MDLGALSGLLFIFINVCLGVYYITQLIISNEINQTLTDIWIREHFHDLVSVRFGLLGVLIGESLVLGILLILLWWVVYHFGVREKYRLLPIRHPVERIRSNLYTESSNVSRSHQLRTVRNVHYLQRLAQILESYGCRFRRQMQFNSEQDVVALGAADGGSRETLAMVCPDSMNENVQNLGQNFTGNSELETDEMLYNQRLEGGVESATCQWKDPDSVLLPSENEQACTSRSMNMRTTEVHMIQSISSRHWSASYSHTIQLLCVYGLVFLCLVVPHCVLQIALDILQQNLPINFIQLSQSRDRLNLDNFSYTTDEDHDIWYTLRDSFGCQTSENSSYCFPSRERTSLDPYDLIHLCAESIHNTENSGHPIPLCSQVVYDWIKGIKWHSSLRLTLFILSYTICISLIVRTVAWPVISSSCQTFPRSNWWKGAGCQELMGSDKRKKSWVFGQPLHRTNRSGPWMEDNHGYYHL